MNKSIFERNNNNVYVMNVEAAYLVKSQCENIEFETKNIDKNKLFSATIPYSLEVMRANEIENEFFLEGEKIYTKLFVNVTFKKDYFITTEDNQKHTIAKKKEIREIIYNNGLKIDNQEYVFYKRGSNKAKTGSDIFVKKEYYNQLIKRSRLGLEFAKNEMLDKTSIHAYEALILSGIEYTINIKPDEILLIDDIYGKEFTSRASITELKNNEIITHTIEEFKQKNCLTDGQGLLDESVFQEYKKENNSFMLLRSDFFKCCAFNTKLRDFWKEKGITQIVEKLDGKETGRILDANKIKLVITPNSLKWLKLDYKFKSKIECYRYWLDNIDNVFGVVKNDRENNFGTANRLTYQLINSLPLTYKQVEELAQDEIEYVMNMKNDLAFFKHHLALNINETLQFEEDINNNTNIEKYETKDLVTAMLQVNSDFQYTELFKRWRKNQIEDYVSNLRKGKIRIKDSIYVTLFSNPYEMLLATIGEYKTTSIMKDRECYCPYYNEGQEFCASRNPHVNSGNVAYLVNKKHDEYRWFNVNQYICIVNFFDNDLPARLQGCDTDSDQMLLFTNKILSDLAKQCEKQYPTPINCIEGDKVLKLNNNEVLAEIDNQLANNYIGRIINKSQIANSYMFDSLKAGKDKETINKYYNASSQLSSLSQIEIDRAKKNFENVSAIKAMRKINEIFEYEFYKIIDENEIQIREEEYIEIQKQNKIVKAIIAIEKLAKALETETEPKRKEFLRKRLEKLNEYVDTLDNIPEKLIETKKYTIVPNFFQYIADCTYRKCRYFECSMDYLEDILDKKIKKPSPTKKVEMKDILVKQKDIEGTTNTKQIQKIYEIIEKCGKKLKGLDINTDLNSKSKQAIKTSIKKEAIKQLKELKISSKTILTILRIAFKITKHKTCDYSKYTMLTLNLLYNSHKFETLNCFLKKTDLEEYLVKSKHGDIDIFNEKYERVIGF